MTAVTYALLLAAGACFAYRLVRGPTLADRVIGVNGLLVVGMSTIAVAAAASGNGAFIPVVIVLTLVGFVGTAIIARYVEGRQG